MTVFVPFISPLSIRPKNSPHLYTFDLVQKDVVCSILNFQCKDY